MPKLKHEDQSGRMKLRWEQLAGWLAACLLGQLAPWPDWLTDWLGAWLAGWLSSKLAGGLAACAWLASELIGWLRVQKCCSTGDPPKSNDFASEW